MGCKMDEFGNWQGVDHFGNPHNLPNGDGVHTCMLCGVGFEDDGFDTCESCDDSVELPEEDFSLALTLAAEMTPTSAKSVIRNNRRSHLTFPSCML